MHKFTITGLLTLIFAVFSNSVLADRIAWCDDLKGDYKGLHGLCNAYWNETDEALRAEILFKFYEKAPAGVEMPEPPQPGLACPCWKGVVLSEIAAVTAPDYCFIGDAIYAFFGSGTYSQTFITNGTGCVYDGQYEIEEEGISVDVTSFAHELDVAGEICLSEMTDILNMHFPDGSGGADCLGSY